MYLTYEEYVEYGGTLDESTFSPLEYRASKSVDRVTFNRVKAMHTVPEAVKMCVFDLIGKEQLYKATLDNMQTSATMKGGTGLMASFSTDGYQETYATGTGNSGEYVKTLTENLVKTSEDVISQYLDTEFDDYGVRLTYRGVY